jgi:hypothetical protein
MLRQAATDLLAVLDREVLQQVVVDAARTGLGAAVALVERSSGRVLQGDVGVREAPARSAEGSAGQPEEAGGPIRRAVRHPARHPD